MVFAIHTSDRIGFKRCRRKWMFSSPLRRNLAQQSGVMTPLWFGTGYHFALEDYHGFQLWPTPQDAFEAYVNACAEDEKPVDAEEHFMLACDMLDHYVDWCEAFHNLRTYAPVINGIARLGCEVNFQIALPQLKQFGWDVEYQGTIDSIFVDPHTGHLWLGEYKTASAFDTVKLETDDQVSAYLWAMNLCLPDETVDGVVYRQFRKKAPVEPLILQSGLLSVNKSQKTSYFKYRRALEKQYPRVPVAKLPEEYQKMLTHLSSGTTFDGDEFISQRLVRRSKNALQAQQMKILVDSYEMLNAPAITTNPTRDCAWDCPFREVCLAMDEDADWEGILSLGYGPKKEVTELWQTRLQIPTTAARHNSIYALAEDVGMTWVNFKEKRGLTLYGASNDAVSSAVD